MQISSFKIARPFVSIAWNIPSQNQPVRLCLIAKSPESGDGLELVTLNSFSYGNSYLAALVDQGEKVVEWLEFWVQAADMVQDAPAARCGVLSNVVLDLAWEEAVAALREQNPDAALETGWDENSANAVAIDIQGLVATPWIHPASRQPWKLCRNDAVLIAAGKSPYSTSLERWFQNKLSTGETCWIEQISFYDGSAVSSGLAVLESGDTAKLLHFNRTGGKMAIWRLPPLSLERFSDALRPKSSASVLTAETAQTTRTPNSLAEVENAILTRGVAHEMHGFFASSPVLESLYVRLALWHSTVAAVYAASQSLQRPFFNLSPESFRIDLVPKTSLMPSAWSFRTVLSKPGQAIPFLVSRDEQRFVPAVDVVKSAAASRFGGAREGQGTVRLSQAADAGDNHVKLEGFLDAAPLRDALEHTLVWVRVPLEGQAISFIASIESDQGGARAGTRFRAVSKSIPAAALRQLKAALSPRRPCQVSVLQSVSPALDVYSLGLVGLRILVANDAHTVSEIEDDLFEIAALLPRDSAVTHLQYLAESADVNERVRRLLNSRNWCGAEEGSNDIPREIWHGVVHELMEFVAVEEEHQVEPEFESYKPAWLQVLAQRELGLRNLTHHVRGVLSAPRVAHEEIAKVVLRFVAGR